MDDSEHLCPLCCEELDLSDREFYPCKCGYQVCMWCWHRIRETESGLCPACRTPYGEDPHQFSAVDVEEVLKANKEKEAAAKRDRQRSSQSNSQQLDRNSPTDDIHNEAAMEVPKDRTQLANMRVIRRNLVYAVGLPPASASEDNLRKPEYFGQYGKIAKIVINRTQATTGDPRRASASAYVTFVHKEDTLSCILALDGFHIDGRNIRASYGTSKYCSAFIKNVRCNNPDCTYLHEMGAAEDTFTKQEIQAGYVTSGRDVLARQQQIVAEQLRLSGSGSSAPRKRIGGGGPSGTGKASAHPVFPPPEYDEPAKASPTLVPPPAGVTRASTLGTTVAPVSLSGRPAARTSSAGSKSPGSTAAPVAAASAASVASLSLPQQRKPVSAASVVAGMHSVSSRPPEQPEPHTTLTPLTPLKRSSKSATRTSSTGDIQEKMSPARSAATKKKNGVSTAGLLQPQSTITQQYADTAIPNGLNGSKTGLSSIGGDPIGPALPMGSAGVSSLGTGPEPIASIGGTGGPSSLLGGDVFTGQLHSNSYSAIGSGKDKWNAGPSGLPPGNAIEGNAIESPPSASTDLWGGTRGHPSDQNLLSGLSGGFGGSRAPGPGTIGNSSSALASLLGISLPTGSGSLQETSNMWSVAPGPVPVTPSPLSSLNSGSVPVQGSVIGGPPVGMGGGSSLIGGVPIGGSGCLSYDNGASGGGNGGTNTKSDIALLQSLLPGVHITSGSDTAGFGTIGGWNGRSGPSSLNGDAIVGNSNGWGSGQGSSAVGTIGGRAIQQQNHRDAGIW
ncbi:hypothetical protein ACA910_005049 [Epithemia clementina (nom. ined.)]